MQKNPRDTDCKKEMTWLKERLAKKIAVVRLNGFDPPSSRLVDTMEKEADTGKNLRKKMLRQARSWRCDDD